MSTPAQIAAAVANAQHSTGPRTPEGKAASSRNATKLGIFSQTDILPGEDPEEYAALVRELEEQYQPAGSLERQLVRDMVRGIWLAARYDRIEYEVMQIRYDGLDSADCDHPLGAIYILDDKVLEKIERRRNTVRRRGQQAFRELLALQKGRTPQHPVVVAPLPSRAHLEAMPPRTPTRQNEPAKVSTPSPKPTPENLALRL